MIPIYRPYSAKNTKKYLNQVVDDNWFTHGGYFNRAVEEKLKDISGSKYVLLLNNGTSATHLLSKALFKKRQIKKVICPNGVYVAAWNSFLFDRNVKLELLDLDPYTWNYDKNILEQKLASEDPSTTAVLVVHNIGNPFEFNFGNFLTVEDNCEGFLGKYHDGVLTGTKCLASSVSFFGNKNITCGEGGAVFTNDTAVYEYISAIHGQGQSNTRFSHSELGNNFRMTNLASAVLYSQLENLDEIMEKKEKLFNAYKKAFENNEKLEPQKIENGNIHSRWMFGLRIMDSKYPEAMKFFYENGVETRPMFYSASDQPYLTSFIETGIVTVNSEKITKKLNEEVVILPSYPDLSLDEFNHVINTVNNYIIK
jgi:perosamine synthetase